MIGMVWVAESLMAIIPHFPHNLDTILNESEIRRGENVKANEFLLHFFRPRHTPRLESRWDDEKMETHLIMRHWSEN